MMNAPWGYLITTSPLGECGSGFGSFGVGCHLLAIPVMVLSSDSEMVANMAMLLACQQMFYIGRRAQTHHGTLSRDRTV